MTSLSSLRQLPSVDRLLGEPTLQELVPAHGHRLVVTAVRQVLEQTREAVRAGGQLPTQSELVAQVAAYLYQHLSPTLRTVINASGVIIHTNLGRAPLSAAARNAIEAAARGYSNLEYDLVQGRRGQRTTHAERLLCELTGAEAALVVNNNAGAVLLALTGLAQGRGVVISRGQLVEIGGGFRVPDVMRQSGAKLIEVGTTNRTHPHGLYEDLTVTGTDSLSVRKGLMGAGGRFFNLALGDNVVFDGTVFVSSWRYDAYQYSLGVWDGSDLDPLEEDLSTPTVRVWDGSTWVKAQYLTIPNAYREDLLGGNATFRLGDQAHLGLTAYAGHLDMTVLDGVTSANQLVQLADWPAVPWYGAVGLNAAWTLGLVEVFGEFAHAFTGASHSGNGALLKAIGDVHIGEIEASLRYYGTDFDNPHARGLANADEYGGMRDRDEQGARLKGTLDPLGWMTTRFMVDYWRRMSMNGISNLELYGRVEVRPVGALALSGFADHKNRDLSKNGREFEYGGESWAEKYGDSVDSYSDYEDEDSYTAYQDYSGYSGAKNYIGGQIKTTWIPRTTLWALYKRTYEDTGYLYPISEEQCCESDFQVGHYWWVKAKVSPMASAAVTLRFRYEDEDVKGDQGTRYWESYLQWDQKLPKRTKFSLRGTLGKTLYDPVNWWEGWCSQDCEVTRDQSCVASSETSSASAADVDEELLYGQIKATFEWRF